MYRRSSRESSARVARRRAVLRRLSNIPLRGAALVALGGSTLLAQARLHPIRIHNPEEIRLSLVQIDDGIGRSPASRRIRGRQIDLLLPIGGRYVVTAHAPGGDFALPVPIPARATLPPRVEVRITPPPPPDPDYAFVPAGPALLGDVLGVGQPDERPARVEDVAAFWIGRREVTNREFAAFLDSQRGSIDPGWIDLGSRKCRIRLDADSGRHTSDRPDEPVVTVSHAGATAYCTWLSASTGVPHRLPTAIEWEKAARGPRSATYAYGDVYERDAANQESGRLAAVGVSGSMNGFGTFDMTGNAFEWTADVYPSGDGLDHAARDAYRELRGGSFVLDGMYLRNSFRMKLRPGVHADDVGFRVLREHPRTPAAERSEDRR
ncbi:MAG: SUMF1/EgtB/PvdO family nonheme iron enzyme [Planctomycetota bacterium]|nr:SUMF1/EgtB/PvdO family nonheme iron enzyme [Planctomycetota bacterium]